MKITHCYTVLRLNRQNSLKGMVSKQLYGVINLKLMQTEFKSECKWFSVLLSVDIIAARTMGIIKLLVLFQIFYSSSSTIRTGCSYFGQVEGR